MAGAPGLGLVGRMSRRWVKADPYWLQDHRIRRLTGEEYKAYWAFWSLSVIHRTETLDPDIASTTYVGRFAGTRPSNVRKLFEKCKKMEEPLLDVGKNGAVTVRGTTKIHAELFRARRVQSKSDKPPVKRETKPAGWTLLGLYRKVSKKDLTPWERSRLKKWEKQFGEERVRYALEQAASYDKVVPSYIEAVLRGDGTKPGSPEEFAKEVEKMK
jgi:hypothetical protein